jgi:hypothetical protein
MQIPRDLSRRMLEAVEQVPIVDIYERLVPERHRVSRRMDFLAWLVAGAEVDLRAMGIGPDELLLLKDVAGAPDERWSVLARYWPFLRTMHSGRLVLRVAWELFGVENIDERTWKDLSAMLWKQAAPGYYLALLQERANIRRMFVDEEVDPATRACCVPIGNLDALLSIRCRPEMASWMRPLDPPAVVTLEVLDALIEQFVQQRIDDGCVGFKMGTLPEVMRPSAEQAMWAFGRVSRCEASAGPVESDLHSHMGHRLLALMGRAQVPVQVHIQRSDDVARLRALAELYPAVRFVGMCAGFVDPGTVSVLGRTLPNVTLALVGVWRLAPQWSGQALRHWIHSVPLNKIFAFGGGMRLVETVCVQALVVRDQIAVLLAEMVAAGELDEEDARWAMVRLLHGNAEAYFDI